MADMMFALGQTKKKKNEETKVRQTKNSLKEVNITDTIEKEIRKEQHSREQKWKATGREQIKKNTNFDMARSLFGGSGTAAARYDDEDDEDVVHQAAEDVKRLAVDDEEEEEADKEEYQEESEEE